MMTRMKEKETKPQDYCGTGYIYIEMTYTLIYEVQIICVQFNLKCQDIQNTSFDNLCVTGSIYCLYLFRLYST